jgi:hypothetical protein
VEWQQVPLGRKHPRPFASVYREPGDCFLSNSCGTHGHRTTGANAATRLLLTILLARVDHPGTGRTDGFELFGPFASFFILRDPLRFAELVDD